MELPLLEVLRPWRFAQVGMVWRRIAHARFFPSLIDLHLRGRLDIEPFVSETIGLDEVEEAFAKMQRGEVLRTVVKM